MIGSTDEGGDEFAHRIRAAIALPESRIITLRQLASSLGISDVSLGKGLRGIARWKPAEIALIDNQLEVEPPSPHEATKSTE